MSFLLAVTLLLSSSLPVFAAEQNNVLKLTPNITQEQKDRFNDWVGYNNNVQEFFVKEGAENVLTESEYELLNTCLSITNENIEAADFKSGEAFIITPEQEEYYGSISTRAYHEGVTKVDFHWWGVTIYLSKSTINNFGDGLSIASIFIPHPVISAVASISGFVEGKFPGGVAFDVTFANLATMSSNPLKAISNLRWQ